ncbi:MAG: methyl-accepting chemotaxis protein [candidate division Zixibacteria bacterium]|nr:methyl-accepting chemotaxis protein [candidate division Zixibacteria bacterium]
MGLIQNKIKSLSISIKTIGVTSLLIVILLGLSFSFLLNRQQNIDIEKKEQELLSISSMLLEGIEYPMLQGEMDVVGSIVNLTAEKKLLAGVRLINPTNEILISNNSDEVGDKINNPVLTSTLKSKTANYLAQDKQLKYYSPIISDERCLDCHDGKAGDLLGVFEMTSSTDDIIGQHAQNRSVFIIIALAVLTVIMVGIYFTLKYTVIKPAKLVKDTLMDIAQGEGDLTRRIDIKSNDEIGRLSYWFNTFADKLYGIISQVAQNTNQLAKTASEISQSSELLSSGVMDQTNQTTQVAVAIEQMTATIIESSKNANESSIKTDKTASLSREGSRFAIDASNGMDNIIDSSKVTAQNIGSLAERAGAIGEIIQIIDDIADQTNLLALNAAIEAARAGEQGRGFAVVADEVRKLAERTTIATKEIAETISAINSDITTANSQIEDSRRVIDNGKKSVLETNSSLDEISTSVESIGDMMNQLSKSAAEQSDTTEQISKNIENVNQISKETAAGVKQSFKAAEQLTQQADQLKELVEGFKL